MVFLSTKSNERRKYGFLSAGEFLHATELSNIIQKSGKETNYANIRHIEEIREYISLTSKHP